MRHAGISRRDISLHRATNARVTDQVDRASPFGADKGTIIRDADIAQRARIACTESNDALHISSAAISVHVDAHDGKRTARLVPHLQTVSVNLLRVGTSRAVRLPSCASTWTEI